MNSGNCADGRWVLYVIQVGGGSGVCAKKLHIFGSLHVLDNYASLARLPFGVRSVGGFP